MTNSVEFGKQLEVRLIQEREARMAALDASIARGIADAERGRVRDIDVIATMLDARYARSLNFDKGSVN